LFLFFSILLSHFFLSKPYSLINIRGDNYPDTWGLAKKLYNAAILLNR
jgi:hypothetical protein